jgi:hypothetical protein
MGVDDLSNSADDVNTKCHDCGGTGVRFELRKAAMIAYPNGLDGALRNPLRQGTAEERTLCRGCGGHGWIPGMTIPV